MTVRELSQQLLQFNPCEDVEVCLKTNSKRVRYLIVKQLSVTRTVRGCYIDIKLPADKKLIGQSNAHT